MKNFFNQKQLPPRALYEQNYKISRMNLLIVTAITAINLILLITNSNSYFLFSAFIPYFIAGTGMMLCGHFPEDYYTDDLAGMNFLDDSFFVITLLIAIVLTLLYLLAWVMSSKNRVGWLIFALVLFGLDTLGMFLINGLALADILDVLFHGWVIYYLIMGIMAHKNLKNLPPEEQTATLEAAPAPTANDPQK